MESSQVVASCFDLKQPYPSRRYMSPASPAIDLPYARLNRKMFDDISSPAELDTFNRAPPLETDEPQHLTLQILQPLTHKTVFEENRNPKSRVYDRSQNPAGVRATETLEISSLGKAWREAWKNVRPESVKEVTFDLSMHLVQEADRVEWKDELSVRDGDVQVMLDERSVVTLLSGMATVMKMRGKGKVEMSVQGSGHGFRMERLVREVQKNLGSVAGGERQ